MSQHNCTFIAHSHSPETRAARLGRSKCPSNVGPVPGSAHQRKLRKPRGQFGNILKKIKVPSQWLWRICFPPSPVCPLYLCQPLGSVALGSWFLCTAGTHFFHSVLPLSNCINNSHCACMVVVAQGRTNIFPLTVIAASPDVSSSYTSWGKNR